MEALPTDKRLEVLKQGEADPALILLYIQFGRYLLVSSSISGELPANLQGKWNDRIHPPWESDYHFDINLQMNYWMTEAANMPECAEALIRYVERFIPHARKAARDLYGCRGIWLPIQTDAWGRATPESHGWAVWIGAAPWIAQHVWWHYLYGGDREFLRSRAYPFFKEIAQFYEDYLIADEQGQLQIMPSQSPENRFAGTGPWPVSIGVSSAMDVQLAYDALGYAIKAARILQVDPEDAARWEDLQRRLPPFRIGKDGRLLEWDREMAEVEPAHRHLSHLYGLFPSTLFNPQERPEEYAAALQSLRFRMEKCGGNLSWGWSHAWAGCLLARAGDGAGVEEQLTRLVRDFASTSLLDRVSPKSDIFQIDGNLGAVAVALEGIAQSWGGAVHLLRALPPSWERGGSVQALRVPGGHVLSFSWRDGRIDELEVCIGYAGSLKLFLPGRESPIEIDGNSGEQWIMNQGG